MDPLFHFSEGALAQGLGDPVVPDDDLFRILFGWAVWLLLPVSLILPFLVHSYARGFKFINM